MLIAKFWCEVLNYEVREESAGLVTIGRCGGDEHETVICFAQVPETKSIKNRLHLDLRPWESTQQDEVDRVLALGAQYADIGQSGDEDWVVLFDPEGNEFCVLSGSM